MSYAAQQIRELLLEGPPEEEDFYRMKLTGNGVGETKWVNISAHAAESLAAALEAEERLWARDARP